MYIIGSKYSDIKIFYCVVFSEKIIRASQHVPVTDRIPRPPPSHLRFVTRNIKSEYQTMPFSPGLYFHIGETERKCFIEEIPDETMVTGNYKVQLYDPRTNGFAASSPEIGRRLLLQ